ncbi:MAG: YbaK/EbsC family protein [Acidimicrobiia bacterium]|nr:YbaK/EbsC family protein [Acidimicrobiia bacterium]
MSTVASSSAADLPEASRRVVAAGASFGVSVEVHQFPEGTKTSQDAADAVGCHLGAITKSLVFMVDDEPVIAMLPGDRRLDATKLATVHGGVSSRRASLDEVRQATGFAAGGTPPFGHDRVLAIYADAGLREHEARWAAAGTPSTVFPISVDELLRATGAAVADLAE